MERNRLIPDMPVNRDSIALSNLLRIDVAPAPPPARHAGRHDRAAEQHGLPNEYMPYAESKGDAPPPALHADRYNDRCRTTWTPRKRAHAIRRK